MVVEGGGEKDETGVNEEGDEADIYKGKGRRGEEKEGGEEEEEEEKAVTVEPWEWMHGMGVCVFGPLRWSSCTGHGNRSIGVLVVESSQWSGSIGPSYFEIEYESPGTGVFALELSHWSGRIGVWYWGLVIGAVTLEPSQWSYRVGVVGVKLEAS